jgi:hypothetical protein
MVERQKVYSYVRLISIVQNGRTTVKYSQKMGGIAALYEAAAYVLGLVFFLFAVDYPGAVQPAQKLALLVNNQLSMQIVTLLIYVAFGAFLVVLALALHSRLQAGSPAIMQTATAFGLIWAGLLIGSGMVFNTGAGAVVALHSSDPSQAAAIWSAIDAVHAGLGGEVEIVGGLWILLASWAALRTGGLPRALNYLGVVAGVAGVLSILPGLSMLVVVFALGQLVWFAWLGLVMLRSSATATVQQALFENPATRQLEANPSGQH